jgi:hypothetical protein
MVEQKVTSDDIWNLGGWFIKLKDSLKPALDGLSNITVTPGDFTDATTLKTTVTTRATEAHTLVQNISDGLEVIGKDLQTTSNDYVNVEDGNQHKATELDALIKDTEGKLPGISTQAPGDGPQVPTK